MTRSQEDQCHLKKKTSHWTQVTGLGLITGRWLPIEQDQGVKGKGTVLTDVIFSTLTFIDKAALVEHMKQEGQKADDVKVSAPLWSFVFK